MFVENHTHTAILCLLFSPWYEPSRVEVGQNGKPLLVAVARSRRHVLQVQCTAVNVAGGRKSVAQPHWDEATAGTSNHIRRIIRAASHHNAASHHTAASCLKASFQHTAASLHTTASHLKASSQHAAASEGRAQTATHTTISVRTPTLKTGASVRITCSTGSCRIKSSVLHMGRALRLKHLSCFNRLQ